MTVSEIALSLRRALVAAHRTKGLALSAAEWLAVAEKCLSECQPTRQKPATAKFTMGAGQSDDEWLAEMAAHPALVGVNVRQEVESCRLWSSSRGVKPSRRRIVNWLLKAVADRPMQSPNQGRFAAAQQNNGNSVGEVEPMGWREEFPDFRDVAEPWHKIDAFNRAHICRQMAELAQKQA